MGNTELTAHLFLSNHTVKAHISRIFVKTGRMQSYGLRATAQ